MQALLTGFKGGEGYLDQVYLSSLKNRLTAQVMLAGSGGGRINLPS